VLYDFAENEAAVVLEDKGTIAAEWSSRSFDAIAENIFQ